MRKLLQDPGPSSPQQLEQWDELLKTTPELPTSLLTKRTGRRKLPALAVTLEKGDIPLTQLLLNRGADATEVAQPGDRPVFSWALKTSESSRVKLELLKLLVKHRADLKRVDALKRNLFHGLVELRYHDGFSELAAYFKAQNVEMEQEDIRGVTPLMAAVMRHDAAAVKALLDLGADPHRISKGLDLSALELAEQQSHTIDHPVEAAEVLGVLRAPR